MHAPDHYTEGIPPASMPGMHDDDVRTNLWGSRRDVTTPWRRGETASPSLPPLSPSLSWRHGGGGGRHTVGLRDFDRLGDDVPRGHGPGGPFRVSFVKLNGGIPSPRSPPPAAFPVPTLSNTLLVFRITATQAQIPSQ